MASNPLIDEYLAGGAQLRAAVTGLTSAQLDATPIPGKWSTRQVICHVADFELVYADRMKRVIAEQEPTFFAGDPDQFAAALAYDQRDAVEELQLVEAVRASMARILRTLDAADFQRIGNHNEAGPQTLASLLEKITHHLQHHVRFIEEKRAALEALNR
ncbi:Putative metal-dependent hydrolase YfiT [Rosistilla carotiformis]|uniref:Metal-dependent hydrolase YfiT n=1 Tax=Rosistilla carotiformis TaxID=2528017 RepID=A0A518JMK7_9BACT|nr:DinB family protein [Rosistilla carotiformis]QDV66772.1 Putative metal-dependent hydrolase YfiT [Rosistilla carotiformis]